MASSGARSWGTFADAASLPNVSASDTTKLLQGDFANVSGVGLYQCDDPTPGSAVWSQVSGGGGGADIQGPRIIVGCSAAPYNDTSDDCDYLDTGDGVQLNAAITAAGTNKFDVWIRPGVYDFSAGAVTFITIPNGVKVRGSGRGSTVIKTNTVGVQRAFQLGAYSELEDVYIQVQKPTGAGTDPNAVVYLLEENSECHRVKIQLMDGPWNATDISNFDPQIGFSAALGTDEYGVKFVDCECDATAIPSNETTLFKCFGSYSPSGDHRVCIYFERCISHGGNVGFAVREGCSSISDCGSYDANTVGIDLEPGSLKVGVKGCFVRMSNAIGTVVGIRNDGPSNQDIISNNEVYATYSINSGTGIEIDSVDCIITGNNIHGGWDSSKALVLLSGGDDAVVVGNDFNGIGYTNSGSGCIITGNHL